MSYDSYNMHYPLPFLSLSQLLPTSLRILDKWSKVSNDIVASYWKHWSMQLSISSVGSKYVKCKEEKNGLRLLLFLSFSHLCFIWLFVLGKEFLRDSVPYIFFLRLQTNFSLEFSPYQHDFFSHNSEYQVFSLYSLNFLGTSHFFVSSTSMLILPKLTSKFLNLILCNLIKSCMFLGILEGITYNKKGSIFLYPYIALMHFPSPRFPIYGLSIFHHSVPFYGGFLSQQQHILYLCIFSISFDFFPFYLK